MDNGADPGDRSSDPGGHDVRALRIRICRRLIRERRLVKDMLGTALCANPNWDMLLDLYLAELEHRSVYQSALCLAAHIPESSAHRWTVKLAEQGVLLRRIDPEDRRRISVTLAPATAAALDQIMESIGEVH
jgi:DNA-binding MarR family transcriptional regulator